MYVNSYGLSPTYTLEATISLCNYFLTNGREGYLERCLINVILTTKWNLLYLKEEKFFILERKKNLVIDKEEKLIKNWGKEINYENIPPSDTLLK